MQRKTKIEKTLKIFRKLFLFLTLVFFICLINSRMTYSAVKKLYLNNNGDLVSNTKVVVSGYHFYKLFNDNDFNYLIANSKKDKQLYLINKKTYAVKRITSNRFLSDAEPEAYITC